MGCIYLVFRYILSMFEYLVTSATRRKLLQALWQGRARGTTSSLARRTGVPLAASYGELEAMNRAGLVRESLESGRVVYEANWNSPHASLLEQLVSARSSETAATRSRPDLERRRASLRSELAAHGAPVWDAVPTSTASAPLEELVARACELAHHDPTLTKLLPYLLVRKKHELRFERLERALTERKQKHTAGFLLALAGTLSGDRMLSSWSERLRDKRRTKPVDFFPDSGSKRLRALAERNTPELARAWGFRLNMSMDDFRGVMEKFPVL
jgi:hypothetical protein